ncbi:MAG TPA: GNAT family protein [Vitreimonas sp.]|nr:GNAT family protein [Vitreimonas sp.]
MTELHGQRVVVRTVEPADHERLIELMADPEIRRWWPAYDAGRVRREMVPFEDDTFGFVILLGGEVVGWIQAWEETEPEFRHAGIDVFVAPDLRGRGLGPDAIRTVARWLIDERGHHRLTIDPRADNAVAIRAYEKVGFRPVGRLRRYQRYPDGSWHDGLLMEMLAEELGQDGQQG